MISHPPPTIFLLLPDPFPHHLPNDPSLANGLGPTIPHWLPTRPFFLFALCIVDAAARRPIHPRLLLCVSPSPPPFHPLY